MNHLERFKAVCRNQPVDYVPTIGLPGASGLSFGGAWGQIYQRLVATGMPAHVKGWDYETGWAAQAGRSWNEFWGTLTPLTIDFFPAEAACGIQQKTTRQDQYEIVEYETGAKTRQVLDNENAYSMPEFLAYHVRDRESWLKYKKLNTPGEPWTTEQIDRACEPYDQREYPLFIGVLSTWGLLRDIAGTELASTLLYDVPELAAEIINWQSDLRRKYLFPLIRRLKPEIIQINEDCCYNHGMLISPRHFEEFCCPAYDEIADLADQCNTEMFIVDTDGDIDQLIPLLIKHGANALYPVEAKANLDFVNLAQKYPDFIFIGGLEKETINENNEHLIEPEISAKVPALLKRGRYFPNLDHSLQPMCTFPNLCRFLAQLYKHTQNPNGQFYKFPK